MAKAKKSQGPTYVYTITHNATGNAYVGITNRKPQARWREHVRIALQNKTNQHIHNAIRLYGADAFDWQIVGLCDTREDAIRAEITWIAAGWGYYNKTQGGEGVVGCERSEETCRKISEAKKGKPAWNKGIPATEETKQKMSEQRKGKAPPQWVCDKAHSANIGKTLPEWHRQLLIDTWTGRKHTEETKAKIGAASKGRKRTAEALAKEKATKEANGTLHKSSGSTENTKKGWVTRKLNMEKKHVLLSMGPVPTEVILDG
jgi:group I intron endonuclease